jgi:uncharacterized phage protein (TIGR01671 family)
MRPIKFRAWDKRRKLMMYDVQAFYGSFWDLLKDENCFVMQYTGLKDKNGKEIYEGDIVDYKGHQVVEYHLGSFVCYEKKLLGNSYRIDYMRNLSDICEAGDMRKFEVIGNIYENKDLLK